MLGWVITTCQHGGE